MPAVGDPTQMSTAAAPVVLAVMQRWQTAVNHHHPDRVAALFTEGALFQGLQPEPVWGTADITDYYAGQPHDLRAEFELIDARYAGDNVITAYLSAVFHAGERHTTPTYLSIVLVDGSAGWRITHYHVSVTP